MVQHVVPLRLFLVCKGKAITTTEGIPDLLAQLVLVNYYLIWCCVYLGAGWQVHRSIWRSEVNYWESVLFFHCGIQGSNLSPQSCGAGAFL